MIWVCEYADLVVGKIDKVNSIVLAETEEELKETVGLSGLRCIVMWKEVDAKELNKIIWRLRE